MRFMMLVKANKECEAGILPDEKILSEMRKYNEELVKAGALLAVDGLQASSKGARVRYSNGKFKVTDGPFAETKELIAGFWLIQVKSKDEAIAWVKRSPNPHPGTETEIEIRQVFEAEDFGPEAAAEDQRLNGAAPTPGDVLGVYRTRQNFQPLVTIQLAKPLTLEAGVSLIGVDAASLQKPAKHIQVDQRCAAQNVFIIENGNNLFDRNVYRFPRGNTSLRFAWGRAVFGWDELRQAGLERNGHLILY